MQILCSFLLFRIKVSTHFHEVSQFAINIQQTTSPVSTMKLYALLTLALLFRNGSAVFSQCEDLISCLDAITGKSPFDVVPPEASQDDFCDNMLAAYQGQKGIDAMCTVAAHLNDRLLANAPSDLKYLRVNEVKQAVSPQSHQESTFPGRARYLAAPACQANFNPEYADDSGSGTSYDTLVAALEGPYLFGGKKQRSDGDAYAAVFIGYLTALVAAGAATGIPIADNVAQIALAAVQSTVESLDVHDGVSIPQRSRRPFRTPRKSSLRVAI